MNEQVEILVCDAQSDLRSTDRVKFWKSPSNSISNLRAEVLNQFVESSQTRFLGFSDKPIEIDLGDLLDRFEHDAESALLLPFGDDSFVIECWQQRTQRFASLVAPPEQHAVVMIDRNALESVGPFDSDSNPIWNWCVRCVREGGQFVVLPRQLGTPPNAALPVLVPQTSEGERWLLRELMALSENELVPRVDSSVDAIALHSGLLLVHDYLEQSHDLSQTTQGKGLHAAGDYWHAIMHRREPDYSNSKYWYRRVGLHPNFATLARCAADILRPCSSSGADDWQIKLGIPDRWDPFAMVDLCSACESAADDELVLAAQKIQQAEMELLLASSYDDATS